MARPRDEAAAPDVETGGGVGVAEVARTDLRLAGGYRDVLAITAFRRLWFAQLCSAFGEALAGIAMPLFAFAVTGSAQLASQVFIAQLVPRIALAPVAGVLADRLDRRRLIVGADLGRAALVALLPLTDQAWQIALLAMLVAVGHAVARPAELAAVPMVVAPWQLVQALSAVQVANSVVRVVGPALGAVVIGLAGPRPAFGLQALCFVASAVALRRLTLPAVARGGPAVGSAVALVRREVRDGLRAVWTNAIVRGTAAVEMLWQTVTAILAIALVVYVEVTIGLGPEGGPVYALLMACFSAGTAVGALAAGRVERRIGRPRLMAIGYLAPLLMIPAGLTPPLPVLFAFWFALGFTDAWALISTQAYLAEAVPDALRGRVYAIWGAVVTVGAAIAFAVVGWATQRIGAPPTIAIAGILVGLGGPLLLLATGALAAMRHHVPVTGE